MAGRSGPNYYQTWKDRLPPQKVGTAEWPQPKEGALAGKNFHVTGVLDTIERDDLKGILKNSGGRNMTVVSDKLDFLVVGRDAGPSKMLRAVERDIPTIDEARFRDYLSNNLKK